MALTPKQKAVYEYIKSYTDEHGLAPTQKEIRDNFGLKSFGSVQKYLKYLMQEGLLQTGWNERRGLKLKEVTENDNEIPLLGNIAAGNPIEAIENPDSTVAIPPTLLKGQGPFFALKVKGDSMIEDGILEDDLVICRHQSSANNGQIVAAVVEGEATLKHIENQGNRVLLHPANENYSPIEVSDGNLKIAGVMVGLIRTF